MPPKGKKNKGGGKKKAAATDKPQEEDDDWAILNEAAATDEPAPAAAEPEVPDAPAAAAEEDAAPPAAPAVDAAAAFLANMGVSEGGEKKDKKKDKKKGKGKGKPKKDADGEEGGDKKPEKISAQGRLVAERLRKQQEEEERVRKLQEEEEARVRAEEEAEAAKLRAIEEEKQKKKDAKKAKDDAKKAAGTYMTKAEKAKARAAAERREQMKAAGLFREDIDKTPSKPVYGKKKGKDDKKKKEEEAKKKAEEEAAAKAAEEAAAKAAEEAAAAAEEEDEGADDWENVADEWDAEGSDIEIPDIGGGDDESDEDEDLVEKERRKEEAELKKKGIEKAKRDAAAEARKKEIEAMEAQMAEEADKAEREAEMKKLEARKRRMEREAEEAAARSTDDLRSPICCIMGHVDTGKTKLLDKIRQTNVQSGEAGGITQQIGATYFPPEKLLEKTQKLNDDLGLVMKLPGLLVIDTPGHEAFSNLRSRGSSLCDIAILVIDLMHGLEQQTIESIEMLRKKKCPFVVALNKVDRCYMWKENEGLEFRDTLALQEEATQAEFRDRMMGVRTQLNEKGLNAELYWENTELASTVSMIPTSAHSGEGVNDLLHMIVRLTQERMAQSLMYSNTLQCTILEVKVIDGLGCTVDVILVNGEMNAGDQLVVCTTNGPVVAQARALLTPPPNRELRIKAQYINHDNIKAAIGVKICAQGLEHAVAGSPIMVYSPEKGDDLNDIKEEVMKDFSSLQTNLATDAEGVFAQASTLGALEALLEFLRNECKPPIPVHAVAIGPIFKRDVMRAGLMHQKGLPQFATILAFDVPIDNDAVTLAEELNVKIFTADIIYHLFDQYTRHLAATLEAEKEKAKEIAVFPSLCKILPNHVFNQKDPIIVGVEVLEGILKVGTPLCIPHNNFLQVGRVTSIESNHQQVDRAKKGTQCAISIVNDGNPNMMFGRQFTDEHPLYSELNRTSIDSLKKYFKDDLTNADWKLVVKLKTVFSII